MIRIPYGISNFEQFHTYNYHYVDRTPYIEQLEQLNQKYFFFVRPRRFGKSLFISTLQYYYDLQYKAQFSDLFGKYYIGKNPTKLANQYYILLFDFSGIDTSSAKNTYRSFLNNVKNSVLTFMGLYPNLFEEKDLKEVKDIPFPAEVIQYLFRLIQLEKGSPKIYLLIDEYDHFANEILAFRFEEFSEIVSQNGYVRKFYEVLKTATRNNIIDRMFITGVSSITLDSLTSGFNIATNISLQAEFNAMMGFKKKEVETILKGVGVPDESLGNVMKEVKNWYDGYLFSKNASERIYNSDMVLYFADNYWQRQAYPDELLDVNVASDYTKIRRLFKIKNKEKEHLTYLNELVQDGTVQAKLVQQFNFERRFDRHDFITLLFYTGILTICKAELDELIFKMPNYVIKQLYFQYFNQMLIEQSNLDADKVDLHSKIKALAIDNDLRPLVQFTETILTQLSTRDKRDFSEKHVKSIFTSVLFTSGIYTIHNEFEVKRAPTEKGFTDILLVRRPPYNPIYQFVIELKYLKKKEARQLEATKKSAVKQLENYLKNDEYLQSLTDLKAYVVIFVGNTGSIVEVSCDSK